MMRKKTSESKDKSKALKPALQAFENLEFEAQNTLWYFDDEYSSISREEKLHIQVLTALSSKKLWHQYVSEEYAHLMRIEESNCKLSNIKKSHYSWSDDWDKDQQDAFIKNITPLVPWLGKEKVVFFWHPFSSVMVSWELLCQHWISFLYDDELNVIINPSSHIALIIGVHGYVATAERV